MVAFLGTPCCNQVFQWAVRQLPLLVAKLTAAAARFLPQLGLLWCSDGLSGLPTDEQVGSATVAACGLAEFHFPLVWTLGRVAQRMLVKAVFVVL
jgi:hypothetical protein